MRFAGLEGCRTEGMQKRRDAGEEGCMIHCLASFAVSYCM